MVDGTSDSTRTLYAMIVSTMVGRYISRYGFHLRDMTEGGGGDGLKPSLYDTG